MFTASDQLTGETVRPLYATQILNISKLGRTHSQPSASRLALSWSEPAASVLISNDVILDSKALGQPQRMGGVRAAAPKIQVLVEVR